MLRTAVKRSSSIGPENAQPEALATIIEWQAAAIAEKLKAARPPQWKTKQQLYDDAMFERYGPGMYMGRLTPTSGFTPTPSPPPQKQAGQVQTPSISNTQLPSPPSVSPSRHNHKDISKRATRTNRGGKSERTLRSIKLPNKNRIKKRTNRNNKHSMVTRSQCCGNCDGWCLLIEKTRDKKIDTPLRKTSIGRCLTKD